MKTALIFDRDEIRPQLRYDLIYETVNRSVYNSGSTKRKFRSMFNDYERKIIETKVIPMAKKFATKGVPDTLTITTREYNVWKSFGRFCLIVG